MKTNRIRILAIATLGVLIAGACVSPAAAQFGSAFKGNFTLPDKVSWQGKVLPAGEYSFSLQTAALPAQIVLRGPSGVQILLTCGRSIGGKSQQSALTIEWRGDSAYVRELYLAPIGVHFHYHVPKIPKEALLAH